MSLPAEQQAGSAVAAGGSFKRRDYLLAHEEEILRLWAENKPYYANLPADVESMSSDAKEASKFFVTFPFPYMNGRLHLGHAFSLTKAEFSARFQRLLGKNVLWPFAFHCTGMPICAAANKLKHELEDQNRELALTPAVSEPSETDISQAAMHAKDYGSKKSKVAAKTGLAKTQREILQNMGIPEDEIPKFADASYWLTYFPPRGQADVTRFGLATDWRRAFITTDANPYFDAFVKWQYRTLLARDRIKFGLRPAIFSRIDDQPCADHDRASGEAVNPQEYTLIKLKVLEVPEAWEERCPGIRSKSVYLVAATLRPETMYGQTNCFVLPEGDYAVVPALERQMNPEDLNAEETGGYVCMKVMTPEQVDSEIQSYFVCSDRSADNMGFQGIVPMKPKGPEDVYHKPHVAMRVSGMEMIGLPVSAPLSVHGRVYALPLPSIKMDKGTGVVTSVPSDSPDDYSVLKDLRTKPKMRAEYNIQDEWVNKDIVEVLEIPGLGRRAAADLCEKYKVSSWKDEAKLKDIKAECYMKGFYEGVMIIGECQGMSVKDAKNVIKDKLIASGDAVAYLEPEKKVVSRSGDNCVVALCNQWYSDFGNPQWKALVMDHVKNHFNAWGQLQNYIHTVDWLQGWACSRNFGLGTDFPWEGQRIVIESLSDSTIYFSYYTLAHYFQSDLYGQEMGSLAIRPEELSDEVFNYVYLQTDEMPKNSTIPQDKLKLMRTTFEYWYPMTLRCSGKDLVPNHLTMSLFHHAAMWPNRPDLWPRGYYVNGHLLLDAEKMSKSTGNFLTLSESIEQYSADATRLALADAGDAVDDANFERQTANGCLMKLYINMQFIEEVVAKKEKAQLRTGPKNLFDQMFENEIKELADKAKDGFENMVMRDALKFSFYEMGSLKDVYRNQLPPAEELHEESIMMWMETFAIVMSPIAPFAAEYIWSTLLKKPELVVNVRWPEFKEPFDPVLHRRFTLLAEFTEDVRRQLEKLNSKTPAASRPNAAVVFVAKQYLGWQQEVLKVLQTLELDPKSYAPIDAKYIDRVKNSDAIKADPKQLKLALAFASFQVKNELALRGPSALQLELAFDERDFLQECHEFIRRNIGLDQVEFVDSSASHDQDPKRAKASTATPGRPAALFYRL